MERNIKKEKLGKKYIAALVMVGIWLALTAANQIAAYAAPQYGFGRNEGRIAPINVNDFHTSQWDRFHNNYQFSSGMDYRFDLGRPTTFDGFVPADVFTVNIRRDAHVSLRPPRYQIFSGNIPTEPVNRLFQQPVNPHFHQPLQPQEANFAPMFDTLGHGVNAAPIGNPLNVQNVGAGEFLPSTSILSSAR
jgi:hypothetical protein